MTLDAILPGVVMCLIAYFCYHAVQGELGLLSYLRLERQIGTLEAEAAAVAGERAALEHRVKLMSPDGVDPDLLDELSRYELGFAHADDIVILNPPE
ncbi:septum formation initiator family protein [Iodidimonas sp. SYSU 1G8]|uniref:FtsB family cell division protein n=1 Tax=Iodidimonas sp. SYSU 1G8 TaxID=3133967 RepID=UPI0031FF18EA